MGQIHGTVAELRIDEADGTEQTISGDLNNITFTRSKNNPEVTTFGDNTVNRLDGLRDLVLDATGVFNSTTAGNIIPLLDDLDAGSSVTLVKYLPAGSVTGEPIYTACMLLNNYAINEPLDGVVTVNFSMAIANGSMTAACAV